MLAAALSMLLVAPADPKAVEALLQRAEEHFRAQRHAEAAAALEAAYELDPQPDVLFNWANAERLAENCARAVELYDRYLEQAADADDELSARYAEVAEEKRDACKESLPEPAPPPVEEEPARAEPAPAEVETMRPEPGPPPGTNADTPEVQQQAWFRDPTGWALTGVGVASLATAAGLIGGGFSRESRATGEPSHSAYLDEIETAGQLAVAGWVMLGVGGALTVGGIIRFAVVGNRGRKRVATPAPGVLRIRF